MTLPRRITEEQQIEAPQTYLVLPKRLVGTLTKGSTTPSVQNVEEWIADNSGAVTITDFLQGQDGQHLYILGDGNTTLDHGTKIFTSSGADLLLATDRAYHFVRRSGIWYQL